MSRPEWPDWWVWELELSSHLLKRMTDRRFTEIDLRRMLERASGYREDVVEGRWVIETRHRGRPWGGYRRTRPGTATAGCRHRLPALGVRG